MGRGPWWPKCRREGGAIHERPCRGVKSPVPDFGGGPGLFSLVASERAGRVVCPYRPASLGPSRRHPGIDRDLVVRDTGRELAPGRLHRTVGTVDAFHGEDELAFDVTLAVADLEHPASPKGVDSC